MICGRSSGIRSISTSARYLWPMCASAGCSEPVDEPIVKGCSAMSRQVGDEGGQNPDLSRLERHGAAAARSGGGNLGDARSLRQSLVGSSLGPHRAPFHCDAAQAAGKITLDAGAIGADLMTLSAHKLGGPSGVGALAVMGDVELTALLRGGGQEQGRRAGTENSPGIAGFAAAARAAAKQIGTYDRIRELRDALEACVAAVAPEAVVVGAAAPRLPNTTAVAMPGVAAETQVIALDLDGVMVSAGAACSSGKVGPSHVLQAMGVGPDIARSTIRVSLGWATSDADVGHFLEAWTALYRRCRGRAPRAGAA